MNICVIEDNPLFRDALIQLLRRTMPEAEISHCGRIGRLPALVADGELPDVVLLDLSLPDTLGHSGIREIKGAYPGARVIALDEVSTPDTADACIQAGAEGFVSKQLEKSELQRAMRSLLALGEVEGESLATLKLTKRQRQLLALLDGGMSNLEIAGDLGISEHTVKVHFWRLFRKLGVKSRTQAIHYARLHDLLPIDAAG